MKSSPFDFVDASKLSCNDMFIIINVDETCYFYHKFSQPKGTCNII